MYFLTTIVNQFNRDFAFKWRKRKHFYHQRWLYMMPNAVSIMLPGYRDNNDNNSPRHSMPKDQVHLPVIRNETSKTKIEKKQNKILSFHNNQRHSFTENLISFFTGGKENFTKSSHPVASNDPIKSFKKETMNHATGSKSNVYRNDITSNAKTRNVSRDKWTGHTHPQLRNKTSARITASTKNEAFRPYTSSSLNKKEKEKRIDKSPDVQSEIGGYETMHTTKQATGKTNAARKRTVELGDYLRRENYRYNERAAKHFLFQKWLKSTEREFPDKIPEDNEVIK